MMSAKRNCKSKDIRPWSVTTGLLAIFQAMPKETQP